MNTPTTPAPAVAEALVEDQTPREEEAVRVPRRFWGSFRIIRTKTLDTLRADLVQADQELLAAEAEAETWHTHYCDETGRADAAETLVNETGDEAAELRDETERLRGELDQARRTNADIAHDIAHVREALAHPETGETLAGAIALSLARKVIADARDRGTDPGRMRVLALLLSLDEAETAKAAAAEVTR
ncbi:hypothetical protein [Streptomyces sp. NPDC051546]|uniref:hypothetical protein n=1 Tax=Streptomyces sp. NPDC051546 TaxID=3365655 RepID=UPI003787BF6D